jgi:putative transcriptional regulator
MSTRKQKPAESEAHKPDWDALDTLTDDEITAQIAANPDAAPDVSDWSLDDPHIVLMEPIDVRAIRAKLRLSQDAFAKTFALSVAALRDWEQQRRMPRGPARTLLRIIDREPEAVMRALRSQPDPTARMIEEVRANLVREHDLPSGTARRARSSAKPAE